MNDVVIVGAGTAGCVLAEQLSRSGRLRVKLIEAGGAPKNRFVGIPAFNHPENRVRPAQREAIS